RAVPVDAGLPGTRPRAVRPGVRRHRRHLRALARGGLTAMAYQFDAQHADGLAGEAFLDALFSRWYRIRPASAAQQRRGIDRWFRTATRRLAVEYKTDHTAARTGNAFVETVSVDTAHKPGWAYTSQADYLVYYIPPDGLVYVLRFAVLRRELARWVA